MRVEERYKRVNYGLLQFTLTITDPKVYTAPWTTTGRITLLPNVELAEHFAFHRRPFSSIMKAPYLRFPSNEVCLSWALLVSL